MIIKKFEFGIGGYGGSSYSLEFKNGLFSYRCTNDEYRLIELINPVIPEGTDPDWDDIITKKDTFDADVHISDKKIERFHNYISRYCKTWQKEYNNHDICDGTYWSCDIWIDEVRLNSSGHELYPKNFNGFLKQLTILIHGKIFK
jgi:hypothetical protein